MFETERRALHGALTLAAVLPLLAACGGGEQAAAPAATTETLATTTAAATGATSAPPEAAATVPSATAADEPTQTAPAPGAIQVRVEGGQPVGGAADITVENGDVVRFVVTSDVVDEVHVHGFDLSKPVGPGNPASFEFEADIEGVFEIELEESAVEIATLTIEPR